MKIKNQTTKNNIQKILIETNPYGGSIVSIIVNNQLTEIYTKNEFIDEILDKINEYMKVIGDDNYARI